MNNGIVFRDEDWNRLKKIGSFNFFVVVSFPVDFYPAEGNPDEEKIGAFGVGAFTSYSLHFLAVLASNPGFYSLFSVTEEPFVTSGGESRPRFCGAVYHMALQVNGWDSTGKTRRIRCVSPLYVAIVSIISCIPALCQAWAAAS